MKKLIFKMITMVLIFVGLSNYMLYLMTGKSPFSDFNMPSLSGGNTPSVKDLMPTGKQTVYKWVDEEGITQYGSEPPANVAAQTLEIDPNLNVIEGIKPEKEKEEADTKNTTASPQVALPQGPIYNPESVKKLMDDAQNVQKLLNERYENQEKALDSL